MRKISLCYNAVDPEAEELVREVLMSGQYSPGSKVREFEEKLSAVHGAKHCVFVNSGTDALRLSLLALKKKYGWSDGDGVAVTTQTFVATVNVILQAGLKPYFYDAGNPWNLEHRMRTSSEPVNIKAIMPVHLMGRPCDDYTFELASKNGWKVLEDSCETILNKPRGDVSCHSTYMAHHLVTGVGGFALTNNADLMWRIRGLANHGRHTNYIPGFPPADPEHRKPENRIGYRFQFTDIGYSCRGTEFEAALGLSQIDHLKQNVRKRRAVAQSLWEIIHPLNVFLADEPAQHPGHTFFAFPLIAREDFVFDKYSFCLHLENAGIETRELMPITNQRCYRDLFKNQSFAVSEHWNKNGFYIPCHPGMTEDDIGQIERAFRSGLSSLHVSDAGTTLAA